MWARENVCPGNPTVFVSRPVSRFPRCARVQIVSKHLVGIFLAVYVTRALSAHISDVQIDTVGVGIMGVGVRVSFVVWVVRVGESV